PEDPYEATKTFSLGAKKSPFETGGIMQNFKALTFSVVESYDGPRQVLGDVLVDESAVPDSFVIHADEVHKWEYLKGSKREERVNKKTGFTYLYSEGSMSFPDSTEKPS